MNPAVRLLLLGGQWTPKRLFAAGEQGGWWDPSDLSTLFQDTAGTTRANVGDPVGLIRDKSGRGNHRTQATAASRPTLQQDASGYFYLSYDGVDDFMVTGSVDFTAANKATVWCAATKSSDTGFGLIAELGTNTDTVDGSFGIGHSGATGDASRRTWVAITRGTAASLLGSAFVYVAPDSRVLTALLDNSGASPTGQTQLRLNGVLQNLAFGSAGTTASNYANAPMYFGRRGGVSSPFNGREYQTIIRGAASSADQIGQVERFIGSKMGIAL